MWAAPGLNRQKERQEEHQKICQIERRQICLHLHAAYILTFVFFIDWKRVNMEAFCISVFHYPQIVKLFQNLSSTRWAQIENSNQNIWKLPMPADLPLREKLSTLQVLGTSGRKRQQNRPVETSENIPRYIRRTSADRSKLRNLTSDYSEWLPQICRCKPQRREGTDVSDEELEPASRTWRGKEKEKEEKKARRKKNSGGVVTAHVWVNVSARFKASVQYYEQMVYRHNVIISYTASPKSPWSFA